MRRLLLLALAAAAPAIAQPAAPSTQNSLAEPGRQLTPGALVANPSGSTAQDVAAVRATPWGRHERARRAARLGNRSTRCVTQATEHTQAGPVNTRGCAEPGAR